MDDRGPRTAGRFPDLGVIAGVRDGRFDQLGSDLGSGGDAREGARVADLKDVLDARNGPECVRHRAFA